MKFIVTKEVEAKNISDAYNRHLKGEGEVVEVFKAKDQPRMERKLEVGFRTGKHN